MKSISIGNLSLKVHDKPITTTREGFWTFYLQCNILRREVFRGSLLAMTISPGFTMA
jgi:hypothetical protein